MKGYSLFFLIGIILILVAVVTDQAGQDFWSDVFSNLGISVTAVTVMEWLWRYIGGEPITSALAALQRELLKLADLIKFLRAQISLLREIEESGIQRLHLIRRKIDTDSWIAEASCASSIDLMGAVLRSRFSNNPAFMEVARERAKEQQCRFRVMLLKPDSPALMQRAEEEQDTHNRINSHAQESLERFHSLRADLGEEIAREYFQLRVIDSEFIRCSVIRMNDHLWATNYLKRTTGGNTPTFEIKGSNTTLYQVYVEQFEIMWKAAEEIDPPGE